VYDTVEIFTEGRQLFLTMHFLGGITYFEVKDIYNRIRDNQRIYTDKFHLKVGSKCRIQR